MKVKTTLLLIVCSITAVVFAGCQRQSKIDTTMKMVYNGSSPQSSPTLTVENEVDAAIKELDSSMKTSNPDELNGKDFTVE